MTHSFIFFFQCAKFNLPCDLLASVCIPSLLSVSVKSFFYSQKHYIIWYQARSLVLYVCFVDRCLSFCIFSFGHCVVCSSIYGFWLPLWYLLTIVLSVLWFTDSDYPFGIIWPLCCLFFDLRILITPLVSFDHCVVCSSIYGFWLPLWYLLAIVLSVLLQYTDSDYLQKYLHKFHESEIKSEIKSVNKTKNLKLCTIVFEI